MKKVLFGLLSVVMICISCEGNPPKKVNIEGNWKFDEHVKGTGDLNVQHQAIVKSIVSVFENGTVNYKSDGTLTMNSPVVGKKQGTYTVNNGKLEQHMGKNSQFILHVQNEGEKLAILFNEDGDASIGKILLVKSK